MLTSHSPNHNRLLDLDQTLLGWKQSAHAKRESFQVQTEEIEQEDIDVNEAIELDEESLEPSDNFSYQGLADRLESRKSVGYGSIRQRLRSAAVKTDSDADIDIDIDIDAEDAFFTLSFFKNSPAAPPLDPEEPPAFSTPLDWQQEFIPETMAFNLPEIKLPEADVTDSIGVGSEDVSVEGFASGSTSYRDLFQSIQAARQRDPADFNDEDFTTDQTKPTIDIKAQTIH